uniref:Uncharacterized protein n=1 Tax=Oryza nivara TaxID=4536 RepID=A0A0E0H963_ORYNI
NPLPTAANPNGAGSSSSKPWEGAATATAEKAGWPTADERGDRADGACTSSSELAIPEVLLEFGVIWQTNCETEQQSTACHCDHCVHGFYHHHRALNEQASYCRLFYATAHTHQLATTSRGF